MILRSAFLFLLLAPLTAQAGICSALLASLKAPAQTREELSFQTSGSLSFSAGDQEWITYTIKEGREIIGDAFPSVPVAFIPTNAMGQDFVVERSLYLGPREVKSKMSGVLLHEWAHILFSERLARDSRTMNFARFMRVESNQRTRGSVWSTISPRAFVNSWLGQAFEVTYPYQELFADAVAALILKNPNVIYHELKKLQLFIENAAPRWSLPLPTEQGNRVNALKLGVRGMAIEMDPDEFETELMATRDALGTTDLTKDPHLTLGGARPAVFNFLMEGRADHSAEDTRRILDIIYRVSRDEIFHRLKAGQWTMAPDQVRKSFVRRLMRYLENE